MSIGLKKCPLTLSPLWGLHSTIEIVWRWQSRVKSITWHGQCQMIALVEWRPLRMLKKDCHYERAEMNLFTPTFSLASCGLSRSVASQKKKHISTLSGVHVHSIKNIVTGHK